ncbi:MAG TPA: LexA family transcriptional regulator [Dehalococcoidia bacterium]|nr:LexA family transcriptional regulator [Dehalococcoidia bacterium]
MESNTLAARLKAFREAKGLTKYRLAKISGVSETYIYRIERGLIKNPRRDTLLKLAQGLGITLAELVGETAPSDTWQLVEQSLKAFVPVYAEIDKGAGMGPVDYVASTRSKIPPDSLRAYRIVGLSFEPDIHSGDTIFVDTSRAPKIGNLVVIIQEGQPAIKIYVGTEEAHIHGVITECNHKLV